MSFRWKTVLGIALIETLLLIILVWASLSQLGRTGEDQLLQRAQTTATLFATTTADAVLAFDLASLESFANEVLKNPGLVYARVRGIDRTLVEDGEASALRRAFVADTHFGTVDDGVFDAAADIVIGGEKYGRVEIGLEVSGLQNELANARRTFSAIAVSELVLSAIFSLVLGALLTSQLRALIKGTSAVSEGRFGYQVEARGNDEIARAVRAFNSMSSGLANLMQENARQRDDLSESRDMLSRLVDNLHGGILLVGRDGLVLHANSPFRSMFRIRPALTGELVGWQFESVIELMIEQFADPGTVRARVGEAVRAGERLSNLGFEMRDGRHLEVDYRPLMANDECHAHLWEIRDVTARVRARAQVQERKRQLDTVFDLSPDGFVHFDSNEIVTSVNSAFTRMTGITPKQADGTHRRQFLGLLRTHCGVIDIDDSNGSRLIRTTIPKPRVLLCSERSLQDESGSKVAHVMYMHDATKERELDEMKSDFLATAAHELRTPLSSVFGFAELLLHFDHDEETRREMITTIHQQSQHLVDMLNELLDLARIEARAGKDFDIRRQPLLPLLRSAAEGFLAEGTDRRPQLKLPETLPAVSVDAGNLQQLLNNVLSNAFKYSPDGGPVEVAAEVKGAAVEVSVSDRGLGMTPGQVERVFERFYRADKSGVIPGSGLGMSLVREIATLHRWSVRVDSQLGTGTTVTLVIPSEEEDKTELGMVG